MSSFDLKVLRHILLPLFEMYGRTEQHFGHTFNDCRHKTHSVQYLLSITF